MLPWYRILYNVSVIKNVEDLLCEQYGWRAMDNSK
jgi:hypothetical protein